MVSFLSPKELAEGISERARTRRLQFDVTQRELADRTGVSFGSVKRFEQTGEISLKHLLRIAVVLNATDDFESLFCTSRHQSVREVLESKKNKQKKRASGKNSS